MIRKAAFILSLCFLVLPGFGQMGLMLNDNDLVNLATPTLSGDATVDSTLTVSEGEWKTSVDSFTYQWYRDTTMLPGATSSTYTPDTLDGGYYVYAKVTAFNGLGEPATVNSDSFQIQTLPDQLENLVFYFDSDLGVTTSGSNVTNWADQSGNANNVSQTTTGNYPQLVSNVLNGYDALRFDGDDYLEFGGPIDSVTSLVVVFSVSSSLPSDCGSDTEPARGLIGGDSFGNRFIYNCNLAVTEGKECYSPRQGNRFNGTTYSDPENEINLRDDAAFWISANNLFGYNSTDDVAIGTYANFIRGHVGDIVFMCAYTDDKGSLLNGLEVYLSNRYNISL